jgi:cation diffusion facilitator family transporter
MRLRPTYVLPPDQQTRLKKVIILEWVTIGFLLSIISVMYLSMGTSQAMKAALIEDCISLIPPVVFLAAIHFRKREPNRDYPYGYNRSTLLAFLSAAVAILILGLFILYEAVHTLMGQHPPTLGHFYLFGQWEVWSGWVMIVALTYSMIPPLVLGRMKLPLATALHESTLYADAAMNRADWLTAAAAILGVLGIALGFWWADAVAAGIIGLDVVRDGIGNTRRAMADLMDHRRAAVATDEPLGIEEEIYTALHGHPGIVDLSVRLREEGHAISGEIFIIFSTFDDLPRRIEEIIDLALDVDWRLHDLVVMPVTSLEAPPPASG